MIHYKSLALEVVGMVSPELEVEILKFGGEHMLNFSES